MERIGLYAVYDVKDSYVCAMVDTAANIGRAFDTDRDCIFKCVKRGSMFQRRYKIEKISMEDDDDKR